MKSLGSLVLSILFGIVVVVLAIKLLGAALKLVAIPVGLALAAGAYFVLKGMIGKGGDRA